MKEKENLTKNVEDIYKFKSLFYNHPEALVYIDSKNRVVDINKKFTELFGYELEEIKGRDIDEGFIHPEELIEEGKMLTKKSQKGPYLNYETVRKKKNGTLFHVRISSSPVFINGKRKGIIVMYEDITDRKKLEEEIKYNATHDSLTGLPNRTLLKGNFDIEKERMKRIKKKLALLLIDLYQFKYINDTFGHDTGDEVLKKVSKRLLESFRKCDMIARIGGDEFVVLLPDIRGVEDINKILIRVLKRFEEPIILDNKKLKIGVNIGISIFPDDAEDLQSLLKRADIAMYNAKLKGSNTFDFFDSDLLEKRRRIEEEIHLSGERFRTIFEKAPLGINLIDKNGKIFMLNKSWEKVFGYKEEEVIYKKSWMEFTYPDDIEENKIFFDKLVNGEIDTYTLEKRFIRKDGEIFWGEVTVSSVKGIDGSFKYAISIIRDITEEKELIRKLEEEKRKAQEYLDIAGVMIVVEDLYGNVLLINKRGSEILGYPENEIVGKNWIDSFTPDEWKDELRGFFKKIREGKIKEVEFHENPVLTRDGKIRFIRWHNTLLKDRNGKIYGLLSSGEDITDVKEAEEKLKISEEKFKILFENSPVGVYIVDEKGRIIDANSTWKKITGYTDEDIKNLTWMDYTHPDDLNKDSSMHKKFLEKAIKERKPANYRIEKRFIRRDGSTFWAILNTTIIFDKNGKFLFEIATIEDITEKKRIEIERERVLRRIKEEKVFYEKLKNISLKLASTRELIGLFYEILKEGKKLVPYISANMTLIENGFLRIVASVGYEKYGIKDYVSNLKIPIDNYPTDKFMVETKKPLVIKDTYNHPLWIKYKETEWIKSYMAVPIILRDKVIGFLKFDSDKTNTFTERDAEKLMPFAEIAAIAIENAKIIKEKELEIEKRKKIEKELKKSFEQIKNLFDQIVITLVKTVELRDKYTAGHQIRVSKLAVEIAKEMNLSENRIKAIKMAGLLHDIGKVAIPASILNKPTKLSDAEFSLIKTHPEVAYEILKEIDFGYPIQEIILEHHERLDGSGYPRGLKGNEIMLEARILAVSDVVEAMTSDRPYRHKLTVDEALYEIIKNKGILYDPDVVEACVRLFKERGFCFKEE